MMRVPARSTMRGARRLSAPIRIEPPFRGWVSADQSGAPQPGGAAVLDEFWPTERGAKVRSGYQLFATLNASAVVRCIADYRLGTLLKLFAFTDAGVFDISSPVSPTTAISPIGSFPRTQGRHSFTQYQTAGGSFLVIVNGADARAVYDGSTWTTAGALQVTGVTTSNLSHVWSYGGRLFYVEKDTFNAWYTAVDTVGGAATLLPFSGVFRFGGSLLFGARVSGDSGQGYDDWCAFVTTEGEVAVYQGGNPSSASTWVLIGVYRIGRPLGPNAGAAYGGDLVIATDTGLVSLKSAMMASQNDGTLQENAFSRPIEPDWSREVTDRASEPWEIIMAPSRRALIVRQPPASGKRDQMFVMHTLTRAWARHTGQDVRSILSTGRFVFGGTSNGRIGFLDTGTSDLGVNYTATYVGLFDGGRNGSVGVSAGIMRCDLVATRDLAPQLSVMTDFIGNLPSAPNAAPDPTQTSTWDNVASIWDNPSTVWDGLRDRRGFTYRQAVSAWGRVGAPAVQITIGGGTDPNCELSGCYLQMEAGEMTA